jgi:hypothetical protein
MRSNHPESIRLYNLKVERTNLRKQFKYVKNEDDRNNLKAELDRVECEIDKIYDAREGEAHIKWLLSNFGEDVFPDRD